MQRPDSNEGIIMSGGALNAEQLAVGRNARVVKVIKGATDALKTRGLTEISDKLDQLLQAVSTHAHGLDNHEELMKSTAAVAEELTKKAPSKVTLTSILDGIASSVKSVTGIVSASEALKAAISAVF